MSSPLRRRPALAGALPRSWLTGMVQGRPRLRAAVLSAGAIGRSIAKAPDGIYTLCYHHVVPDAAVPFRDQMTFLARCGRFISADDAVERLRAGRGADERCFVVTFDDGYLDNAAVALPVVAALRIPAMLFLGVSSITGFPTAGK